MADAILWINGYPVTLDELEAMFPEIMTLPLPEALAKLPQLVGITDEPLPVSKARYYVGPKETFEPEHPAHDMMVILEDLENQLLTEVAKLKALGPKSEDVNAYAIRFNIEDIRLELKSANRKLLMVSKLSD